MKMYEWTLEGLDCANCAAKIERAVAKTPGISEASVNFMQKKLRFSAENDVDLSALEHLILEIEPEVTIEKEAKTGCHCEHCHEEEHEEGSTRARILRIALAAVLFGLSLLLPLPDSAKIALALAAYLIVGADVLWRAIKNILHGAIFDENFLMTLATVGAVAVGQYEEAVGVMLFYQLGELFQDVAVGRSRRSIRDLMNIRPDYANVQVGDQVEKRDPATVQLGDVIVIRPGERVPLDAEVLSGDSMLDTAALTGESVPRSVHPGDAVISGCVNLEGVLTARVTHSFSESTASKILDLVENATSKKAKAENFITKFAHYYTPAVVFSALALALIPPIFVGNFSSWVYRALIFLVISCPCALVISVPLSFFCGIGSASRRGILIKGSNYLDALARVKTVVFDKTGTLTRGVFRVQGVYPVTMSREQLLEYAALAENSSIHPIAASIRDAYGKPLDAARVTEIREVPGHGVHAQIDGNTVLVGNSKLLASAHIAFVLPELPGTMVLVAVNGVFAGSIVIADEIKPDSAAAIRALHEAGVQKTVMLTGDRKTIAENIADELQIDEVYAELLPADKLNHIEELLPEGTLAFVGDGVNDAPALARADIGVAMGGLGSDAAIEAADIVLMTDEPSRLATALKISRKTLRIVYENIVFSLIVKAFFLALGAFGIATMWEAVFADVGVAVIAILNAVRAIRIQDPVK